MKIELVPKIFSPTSALSYEDFYKTEYGRTIDRYEKSLMENLVREVFPLEKQRDLRLLEVGCGTGVWTEFFTRLGFAVWGIDPSEAMLQVAQSKHLEGVTFQQGTAENIPFPDGSFDAVTAITVLEFVEDISHALREIERVLKPRGVFFGGFLNRDSELGKRQAEDPIIRHGSLYNSAEIQRFLSFFQEVTISGCIHLSNKGEILDERPEKTQFAPAFLAVRALKLSRDIAG